MNILSLVVPCYNEQEVLDQFHAEVCAVLARIPDVKAEILFIDDGSKDATLDRIHALCKRDERVRFISFSRNFGKEAALYAGLKNANGDYVAVLDADLQHPPELLIEMYEAIRSGAYDCAAMYSPSRKGEPPLRTAFSKLFYKLMRKLSKTNMEEGARDYRLMSRKMVNAILSISEYNRFSKGIFGWVGFKIKWIPCEIVERAAGETKWSFSSLLTYALDGIIAFSTAPLVISSITGLIFFVIAIIMILVIMIKTIVWGDPVAGFPTLICVLFFIGGSIMLSIGVVGQYLAKMYIEVKNRPIYIVDTTEKDLK